MANYARIPAELRAIPQWVVWAYEDRGGPKPTKVPYSPHSRHHRQLANVLDPRTWGTFEEALAAVVDYSGIGFVMTENDRYGLIEFDFTDKPELLAKQREIFASINTYAEISPSGKGLHMIGKFTIPLPGRKRGPIEVYCNLRYMAMTGDVYEGRDQINDIQDKALALYRDLGRTNQAINYYVDEPQREDDRAVWDKAASAVNGEKFKALWNGQWSELQYPSQSEADFAIMDIIAFYTRNRQQICNLFWQSGLGQRPKSRRIDYLNWMLNRVFDRDIETPDISDLKACLEIERELMIKKGTGNGYHGEAGPVPSYTSAPATGVAGHGTLNGGQGYVNGYPYDIPTTPEVHSNNGMERSEVNNSVNWEWPPGLVGEIASFIYQQSTHPMREASIAAALGLLAGIIGRAYNTPTGAGLNLYLVLLAKTGRGKEAMASGISKLMNVHVRKLVPACEGFIGPAEFRSDAALLKALERQPCQISVQGEFGLTLKAMLGEHAPSHLIALKKILLDAYMKSGFGNYIRPMVYSEAQKNTANIPWPSLTLLAESTPETYFEIVDEATIRHGLLPRIVTMLFEGRREYSNVQAAFVQPNPRMVERLAGLSNQSSTLQQSGRVINVTFAPGMEAVSKAYDDLMTDRINDTDADFKTQMWNRAHLNALKIASLLAVGINSYMPTITLAEWNWAVALVERGIQDVLKKFEAGEVGRQSDANQSKQIEVVKWAARKWYLRPWSEVKGYFEKDAYKFEYMHSQKADIPYKFIFNCIHTRPEFKHDKVGAPEAIKRTCQRMCEMSIWLKMDERACMAAYKFGGLTWRIVSYNDLGE